MGVCEEDGGEGREGEDASQMPSKGTMKEDRESGAQKSIPCMLQFVFNPIPCGCLTVDSQR